MGFVNAWGISPIFGYQKNSMIAGCYKLLQNFYISLVAKPGLFVAPLWGLGAKVDGSPRSEATEGVDRRGRGPRSEATGDAPTAQLSRRLWYTPAGLRQAPAGLLPAG